MPEAGVGLVHFALGPRDSATLIVRRQVGGAGSMARALVML